MRIISKTRILLAQIKMKRNKMYVMADRLGFTHPQVIACSQELDHLLNQYDKIKALDQVYKFHGQSVSNF
ncbi:hypothetical protein AU377_13975 [Sporosarcina sp. HYO08]|nr:aspartyl-phosphate phosphatase Spo0E family protein [Sporosarcina sp. HYO08]KXH86852.1 hypothetical protein AU377_13975 [Sporosarcina sp. HYO08]